MSDAKENYQPNQAALLTWIQNAAPYGVVVLDKSYRVQSWNHWMEVHSLLRPEDTVGKSILTLFPDLDQRRMADLFERALRGESCVLSTALHHHLLPMPAVGRQAGQGTMRQTARVSPLLSAEEVSGVVIVIEDVTQREEQSYALVQQHRRQEILTWTSAHLLKSEEPWKTIRQLFFKVAEHLDFDTFFLYLRDAETNALNLYTMGGVVPDAEGEFAHDALLRSAADSRGTLVLDRILSRPEPEYEALKKAGVSAAVAIPLIAQNRSLGALCFGTSNRERITPGELELLTTIGEYLATSVDRERVHQQLEKAKQELSDHAQLLEKKVQERTARLKDTISELEIFSYTLAHDLKAPVRAMLQYCGILLEEFGDILPAEAAEIVRRLERPSKRMEALILDLLEFSKVSRQEFTVGRVEVEPVINDVLALRSLDRHTITVCSPFHAVRAHKDLLRHVLLNLLDNAIKFVKPGAQPSITISSELVTHSSPSTRSNALLFSSRAAPAAEAAEPQANASVVRIWVRDQGIGVRPELHQKIFGIFERGVEGERYDGTGMGLAIVARAMQRMSGTCGLESTFGQGSQFWIELPAA